MKRMTDRIPLLAWLILTWILLWGSLSPLVLISALVVTPLCLAVCRLPALRPSSRPRVEYIPVALSRFLIDLIIASAQVAWASLRRGPRVRSAIVTIPVSCSSDMALTVVANRITLVPGTLVVDVDRRHQRLYLYVFDVRSEQDLRRARRDARRGALDVLRTLGEPETSQQLQ